MFKKVFLGITILSLITQFGVVASVTDYGTVDNGSPADKRTLESEKGVVYTVHFDSNNLMLNISAYNPNEEYVSSWLDIELDRTTVRNGEFNMSAHETRNISYNLSGSITANRNQHALQIGTVGDYTAYGFELILNTSSDVPLPEIENVEVTSATIDGEETTALRITVRNEAKVQYLTDIRVTTLETHSGPHSGRVPIEENRRTILVPLNEEPEMIVAGEVRLFTGWVHNDSRIADQVEFEGTVDGGTEVWDREFEPIQIDYANRDVDEYQYRNATVKAKNDEIWRERLKPVAAVAGVMLVGILLVVSLLSRRR